MATPTSMGSAPLKLTAPPINLSSMGSVPANHPTEQSTTSAFPAPPTAISPATDSAYATQAITLMSLSSYASLTTIARPTLPPIRMGSANVIMAITSKELNAFLKAHAKMDTLGTESAVNALLGFTLTSSPTNVSPAMPSIASYPGPHAYPTPTGRVQTANATQATIYTITSVLLAPPIPTGRGVPASAIKATIPSGPAAHALLASLTLSTTPFKMSVSATLDTTIRSPHATSVIPHAQHAREEPAISASAAATPAILPNPGSAPRDREESVPTVNTSMRTTNAPPALPTVPFALLEIPVKLVRPITH
ncbi:unnamed protein product [Sphagnum balticum]